MPWHALRRSAVCTHHRWGHVSCSPEYFNCLFRGIWYSLYQKQWVPRTKAAALEWKEGPGLGIWILFFVLAGGFSSSRCIWTYLRRCVAVIVTVSPSSPHFPLWNGGGGEQVESLFASGLLLPGTFSFLSVQDVRIRERGQSWEASETIIPACALQTVCGGSSGCFRDSVNIVSDAVNSSKSCDNKKKHF